MAGRPFLSMKLPFDSRNALPLPAKYASGHQACQVPLFHYIVMLFTL